MSGRSREIPKPSKTVFNPKALLLSVLDELQAELKHKGLTTDCIYEGANDEIIADAEMLRTIIKGLLNNTIDRTNHSTIDILLDCTACGPETLVMMIDDQGRPIFAQRVVDGNRCGSSDKALNDLAYIQQLVEILSGTLQIEKDEDATNFFILTLPIQRPPGQWALSPKWSEVVVH